jgi:uncharacterized oxidoreductase
MKTSGNTVLITGGATGIGFALAEALAKRSNEVVICGRRRERLQEARQRIPQLTVKVCDVSRAASRNTLARWLEKRFPALNILVNNAGIQRPFDFLAGRRDLPTADQEIATNLAAPIHLTALLLPLLRKQSAAAIVNVSSGLGFTPLATVPVYCATKAGIHSLSMTLRHQLRNTPVKVFEIIPPIVQSELHGERWRPDPSRRIMTSEEAAAGIVAAMESDRYEAALGVAVNLREQREKLFPMLNPS